VNTGAFVAPGFVVVAVLVRPPPATVESEAADTAAV
jgi:hypothetical protein